MSEQETENKVAEEASEVTEDIQTLRQSMLRLLSRIQHLHPPNLLRKHFPKMKMGVRLPLLSKII